MATVNDVLSYETASGLMNSNLSDVQELFYQARRKFLQKIYIRAFASSNPSDAWLDRNRYFFLVTGNFDYTTSGKIYQLSNTFVYACAPKEYEFIEKAATEQGATLTPSNFAAWLLAGAFETFYW